MERIIQVVSSKMLSGIYIIRVAEGKISWEIKNQEFKLANPPMEDP